MRIGNTTDSDFGSAMNIASSEIQEAYHAQMSELTKPTPIKVMLGDTTITDQTTFDVDLVRRYYASVTESLDKSWSTQDISETNDADLRRIFVKFETMISDYVMSGHISIQFHALLYYKPDNRVAQIQLELAEITESLKGSQEMIAERGEIIIADHLRKIGHIEPNHEKLFELLYNDESLVKNISQEVERSTDNKTADLAKRQEILLHKLDSLLVETYSTTPVLIDDARLVTGEEGFLCVMDVEKINVDANGIKTREGLFDLQEIPDVTKKNILDRIEQIKHAVSKGIKEPE